jgi:hypothetical protein
MNLIIIWTICGVLSGILFLTWDYIEFKEFRIGDTIFLIFSFLSGVIGLIIMINALIKSFHNKKEKINDKSIHSESLY